jgi:hypothetical protein
MMSEAPRRASATATPEEILRALADPDRLAIVGALAGGERSLHDLTRLSSLSAHRARRHLGRLSSVGLVRVNPDRHTYRLDVEVLRAAAREVGPTREPGVPLGTVFDEDAAVLRQYFRGGRLREIPAKRSKRLIVLERLSLEFEPGVRYGEREVNETLSRFHEDHASLRRYLVDEGFLSRHGARYWRSGGRVELQG